MWVRLGFLRKFEGCIGVRGWVIVIENLLRRKIEMIYGFV